MNKILLICLCIVTLITSSFIGLTFLFRNTKAQGEEIIVQDADYQSTILTEYSSNLTTAAENVTPRIIMEYVASVSLFTLNKSEELNQASGTVTSRIIVEYADSTLEYGLESVIVPNITPRIIVEYADYVSSTDLGPKPPEDMTPPEISDPIQDPSDNVQPLQNVTVTVTVIDSGSGVHNVTLWYSINDGFSWIPRPMTEISADTYQATIFGYQNCTWVTYKIVAYDNAGNSATKDNNTLYYKYHVIPEFSSTVILPLLMAITTLAITIAKRKHKR